MPFEVPQGWVWTTVAEISKSILYGVSESAKTSGAYKLLRITDIQENNVDWDTVPFTDYDESKVGIYLLEENDILFARTGATVGKSYLVKGLCESSIYASYLIRVQTFKEILPQYVKYFFESGFYWEQIERSSVGIGQPNVNGTTLGNLRLPIPPINEQERIVSELKKWIAVITSIEANKNDLQGYIESAKSKILDLAIHGKLVPQDANDEPAIELLHRINPNFTPCDNGHNQNIPQGWVSCQLKDIVKLTMGQSPNGESLNTNTGIEFHQGKICFTEKYISKSDKYTTEPTKIVEPNSLLLCVRAPVGDINITPREICIGRGLCGVVPIKGDLTFFYYLFLGLKDSFDSKATGSTFKAISGDIIKEEQIILPPHAEQQRIVARIEELFATLDKMQNSLEA